MKRLPDSKRQLIASPTQAEVRAALKDLASYLEAPRRANEKRASKAKGVINRVAAARVKRAREDRKALAAGKRKRRAR